MDTDSNLDDLAAQPQEVPKSGAEMEVSQDAAQLQPGQTAAQGSNHLAETAASADQEPSTEQAPDVDPDQDATTGDAASATPTESDPLTALGLRAQAARLPAADEETLCNLLKEALLSGKTGLANAAENLPRIPWIVGVRAVEAVWAEMKATSRTQLLKSLADNESDSARRFRLSLARALFKLDPATGLKLAITLCKEFKDKETGLISQKNAQIFANVFIGKAKPWIGQIPLADLKPADADLLVHCAVLAAFSLPHSPLSQLGVLKWAGERLAKLHPAALAAAQGGLPRWSNKWQNSLRNEVPDLPEELKSMLKPIDAAGSDSRNQAEPAKDSAAQDDQEASAEGGETTQETPAAESERPRKERPVYEPRPQRNQGNQNEQPAREPERESRKERPVYQGRNAQNTQSFNLNETLRAIEAHVQSLRNELTSAQAKLRQREDSPRKEKRQVERAIIIPGEPTVEELARLNLQLEGRITELQQRINDLGADAEDRAASMGISGTQPVTDTDQQLRTLLGLKLQEDYADFLALQSESTSVVVQQHYRSLLAHIFEVLKNEGIPFQD